MQEAITNPGVERKLAETFTNQMIETIVIEWGGNIPRVFFVTGIQDNTH